MIVLCSECGYALKIIRDEKVELLVGPCRHCMKRVIDDEPEYKLIERAKAIGMRQKRVWPVRH